MKSSSHCSMKLRSGPIGPLAAHRTSVLQHSVPSTGRGGPASTSGRGQLALTPARADGVIRHVMHKETAPLHQGAIGLSDLFNQPPADPELSPRKLMNRRIKSCNTPAELASLVMNEISNFDNQNTSHALARLAKMYMARTRKLAACDVAELQQVQAELRPATDALTRRMHQLIGSYETWDTTMSLWSYAQLGHHDEVALRTLCDAALEVAPILKPADCANTVVAFAYLDYLHTELLRQIVSTMLDNLEDFSPGEVAQVVWGLAKMACHPGEAFLVEVVDAAHRRMPHYSTQELILLLWSLVRLGFKPGVRFLRDAETTLLQRLPHLTTGDVCMSVWSLSRLRYKAVRLLDEVPQAVGPRLFTCSNAELCALISGFATAHHYHRVLLDAVAAVALSRLPTLSHQEVCVLLWTYGAFHHRPAPSDFGKQLAAALLVRMAHFTPQGLAMTVKALAQLQWRSEAVLVELVAAAEQKLQAFKPLEMSQLLYGLSALQCKNLNIFFAVVRRCIAILQNPQHPHYGHLLHHRVVNSIIFSCQQQGYVPWTLIDFAESKGIRVMQPDILSSRDEEDEGMSGIGPAISAMAMAAAAAPGLAAAAPAGNAGAADSRQRSAEFGAVAETAEAAVQSLSGSARTGAVGGEGQGAVAAAEAEAEEDAGLELAEELATAMSGRYAPLGDRQSRRQGDMWPYRPPQPLQQQEPEQQRLRQPAAHDDPEHSQQQLHQPPWRRPADSLLQLQQLNGEAGPVLHGQPHHLNGLSGASPDSGEHAAAAVVPGLEPGSAPAMEDSGWDVGLGQDQAKPQARLVDSTQADAAGRVLKPRPRPRRPAGGPTAAVSLSPRPSPTVQAVADATGVVHSAGAGVAEDAGVGFAAAGDDDVRVAPPQSLAPRVGLVPPPPARLVALQRRHSSAPRPGSPPPPPPPAARRGR